MATLQDYLGITALRDAWPKWKANVVAVNNQVINHVAGSADKHLTSHIINDSSEVGTTTADAINTNMAKVATHVAGTADKHAAENITYTGIAGGTEVETAINSLKSDIDNVAAGGTDHDALVTAALVDAEGVDFGVAGLGTYLDGRLTKWEQDAIAYKAETTTKLNRLMISITDSPYNSVGDFDEVSGVGTDNRLLIQACFDDVPTYSNILIPDGIFMISDNIIPREGQTVTFVGKIVLANPLAVGVMLRISYPNITLNNPHLDMRKDHNIDNGNPGTQCVIDNYGTGFNAILNGGLIENSVQSGFAGGRSGLTINYTEFINVNEHGLYINGIVGVDGNSENLILNNVKVNGVAGAGGDGREGVKIRNFKNVMIFNPNIDCGTPPIASRLFMMTNVQDAKIIGGIGKGYTHYGILIDSLCKNISFDKFTPTRGSLLGGTSKLCDTSGTNITFTECVSYGSVPGDANKFRDCDFIDMPGECYIGSINPKFRGCKFYSSDTSSGIMRTSGGVPDIDDCDFFGDPPHGIWYGLDSTTVPQRLKIKNSRFHNYTGNNALLIQDGKDHQFIANEFPVSTSSSCFKISVSTGTILLADNYIPNGGMNIIEGTVVILRDNLTVA